LGVEEEVSRLQIVVKKPEVVCSGYTDAGLAHQTYKLADL
jgi:hypothetical protein